MLYAYKVDTANFEVDLERDVVADYKRGKGDPGNFFSLERLAKKSAKKKSKILKMKQA